MRKSLSNVKFIVRSKRSIAILLSFILTLGFAMSLTAAVVGDFFTEEPSYFDDSEVTICESYSNVSCDPNLVDNQIERLLELLHGDVIVPFAFSDEDFNVPRVNLIIPPEGDRQYFLVGVVGEPSRECIDFILSYAGIPRELAYIAEGSIERQVLREYVGYEHDSNTVPQDVEYVQIAPFMPLALRMGNMVSIHSQGYMRKPRFF